MFQQCLPGNRIHFTCDGGVDLIHNHQQIGIRLPGSAPRHANRKATLGAVTPKPVHNGTLEETERGIIL